MSVVNEIPLPHSWSDCPQWWRTLVNEIKKEAVAEGITDSNSEYWTEYLDKKLSKKHGARLDRHGQSGLSFENDEDFLVFRLKYGC